MTFQRRGLGRAVLVMTILLGASAVSQAQQTPAGLPDFPGLPLPEAPKSPEAPPAPLPAVTPVMPTPAPAPAAPIMPAPAAPIMPAMAPDHAAAGQPAPFPAPAADSPVKDIVLESGDGQTPSNPTGRQEPGVSMEWIYPAIVRLGQPMTCTIMVKCISINRLHHVTVRTRIPASVTVKGTEPPAVNEGELLTWDLGSMEPGQEKRLDINMTPTVKGALPCQAYVTFTGTSTARIEVREPKLEIKASCPKQALKGDVAIVALTVSNPGDARTDHVKVRVDLSEGLKYGNGKNTEILLESLGANESRTFLLQCMAEAAGTQFCSAIATAECNLEAKCSTGLEILTPGIDVVVTGPKMRYLDRNATFVFKVTNPGSATASHVTLNNQVPVGFKVVGASGGAFHDFATRTVVWFIGNLEPGQSKEVSLELLAINPGEYKNLTTVTAARGLHAEAEVATRVEGLPGLLMEVVDVQDPIELGKEESYEIRLTNTGTKTESNLQVTCTIPDQMEFRGAKSSINSPFHVEGRKVVFDALPKLAPRADVIYRVNVLCRQAGDVRFQAQVTGDNLSSPVIREESTRVFGDEGETSSVSGQK